MKITEKQMTIVPQKLISQLDIDNVNYKISSEAEYIYDRAGRNQEEINRNVDARINTIETFIGQNPKAYGLEIDFENETFKRLGDASSFPMDLTAQSSTNPFDDVLPWSGMKRCVLTDDKQVVAYYGESGYEESGTTGQVMVQIPKFYYKVVPVKLEANPNGLLGKQALKLQYWISILPQEGYKLHPAFYDADNNIVSYLYFSAYEGCVWNKTTGLYNLADENWTLNTDMLSSIANAKPASGNGSNQLTIGNARKLANNRGKGWEQQDFTSVSAIQLLYLIEYANTDSQTKIGKGVVDLASGTGNESLITGQTSVLGNKSGMKSGEIDGKCSVSYRGIENFWGNIWKFVDGINIEGKNKNVTWIANNNGDYKNNTANGQSNGFNLSKADGYIDRIVYLESVDYSFMGTRSTGSSSKPMNDFFYQNSSYDGFLIALLGGWWHRGSSAGCFCWSAYAAASARDRAVGARLACR